MRFLIQSVDQAGVTIENHTTSIQRWILVYIAIARDDIEDYEPKIEKFVHRLHRAKLLQSLDGTISSSLTEIKGEILLISNFTLYGENKKWNKINFSKSANFKDAQKIYQQLKTKLQRNFPLVKTGKFGAMMTIDATNVWPINYVRDF